MKYEITETQLLKMLEMQKECTDALNALSKIGIEVEGMKLSIPQEYALLNLLFDIFGLPEEGFVKFKRENPCASNQWLCEQFSKKMDEETYSFCRDNPIDDCLKLLSENKIKECLKYMIEEAEECKKSSKKN
jgi:hypothetical protein